MFYKYIKDACKPLRENSFSREDLLLPPSLIITIQRCPASHSASPCLGPGPQVPSAGPESAATSSALSFFPRALASIQSISICPRASTSCASFCERSFRSWSYPFTRSATIARTGSGMSLKTDCLPSRGCVTLTKAWILSWSTLLEATRLGYTKTRPQQKINTRAHSMLAPLPPAPASSSQHHHQMLRHARADTGHLELTTDTAGSSDYPKQLPPGEAPTLCGADSSTANPGKTLHLEGWAKSQSRQHTLISHGAWSH